MFNYRVLFCFEIFFFFLWILNHGWLINVRNFLICKCHSCRSSFSHECWNALFPSGVLWFLCSSQLAEAAGRGGLPRECLVFSESVSVKGCIGWFTQRQWCFFVEEIGNDARLRVELLWQALGPRVHFTVVLLTSRNVQIQMNKS